jgi:hypothetical protein
MRRLICRKIAPRAHLSVSLGCFENRRTTERRRNPPGRTWPHFVGHPRVHVAAWWSHTLRRRNMLGMVVESDFSNLLSTSPTRWSTLRMSGRVWRDTLVLRQAWEAARARREASGAMVTTTATGRNDRPRRRELDHTWSLWLAPPWKRATFRVGADVVDVVFHGTTWWSKGHGTSRSNEAVDPSRYRHGLGYGEDLIRPPDYVTRLEVEHLHPASWLGRPTLEVRASAVHRHRERGKGLRVLSSATPTGSTCRWTSSAG